MDPDISFRKKVLQHLDDLERRANIDRQQTDWNIELFRQANLQGTHATHARDAIIEFERLSHEVKIIVHEINGLLPVIVWVWDTVKNSVDLMAHLSKLEEKVRNETRHHDKHPHFFERYTQNTIHQAFSVFTAATKTLLSLFNDDADWRTDKATTLDRIHNAQDSVILSGVFLELLIETAIPGKLLTPQGERDLLAALHHLIHLGQTLHLKENRLTASRSSVG